MRSWSGRSLVTAVALACLGSLVVGQPSEAATAPRAKDLVSRVPSTKTPGVLQNGTGDAAVLAVAMVGNRGVLGGKFMEVSDPDTTVHAARNLVVYDRSTGAVTKTFAVYGTVNALLPGPTKGTAYVGGTFNRINTATAHKVALVNLETGRVVRSFKAPSFDAQVLDLVRVGSHLLVGGKFHHVGGKAQSSLVSLSTTTGRNDHWVSLTFSGHHNWRGGTNASTRVGLVSMALDRKHNRLVVIGNFTKVGSLPRDQIALINLTGTHPTVSRTWATRALTAACDQKNWDSWVRDVAVSPDGSYAVVASSGGPRAKTPCDGAVRLGLNTRSTAVKPTWIASAGGDTLSAVAIGAKVVYVGGHQRWLNNNGGRAQAAAGAVPRPSLAALDPKTGIPYSWNPGRHPRGVGVTALLLTRKGLFIGSDTDYLGNRQYYRPRFSFLPLAGGTRLASTKPAKYPDVYRARLPQLAAGQIQRLHLAASGAVDYRWPTPLSSSVDWATVRGAYVAGRWLWTAEVQGGEGVLVRRTFNGSSLGSPVVLAPWADPAWRDQQTGSYGDQTYLGKPSGLVPAIPTISAITYANGRLYYTLRGSTALHWRFFNPQSGIVGDRVHIPPAVKVSSKTRGMFVQGKWLYLAGANGKLTRRALSSSGTVAKTGKVVSSPSIDGTNWSRGIIFSGRGPRPPA